MTFPRALQVGQSNVWDPKHLGHSFGLYGVEDCWCVAFLGEKGVTSCSMAKSTAQGSAASAMAFPRAVGPALT